MAKTTKADVTDPAPKVDETISPPEEQDGPGAERTVRKGVEVETGRPPLAKVAEELYEAEKPPPDRIYNSDPDRG